MLIPTVIRATISQATIGSNNLYASSRKMRSQRTRQPDARAKSSVAKFIRAMDPRFQKIRTERDTFPSTTPNKTSNENNTAKEEYNPYLDEKDLRPFQQDDGKDLNFSYLRDREIAIFPQHSHTNTAEPNPTKKSTTTDTVLSTTEPLVTTHFRSTPSLSWP